MNRERDPGTVSSSLDVGALEEVLTEKADRSVHIYRSSLQTTDKGEYALARGAGDGWLVVVGAEDPDFEVEFALEWKEDVLSVCPCTPANAQLLRDTFPWTAPQPLGTVSAIGCGDRLGVATPGHIRACREADVVPVLAQQSIREMQRTGRSPQEVLDDVTWAVFREGYTAGFGADADHLKREEHVDVCLAAGYTMYTIDPSEYVSDAADRLAGEKLTSRYFDLPWEELDTTPEACIDRYTGEPILIDNGDEAARVEFDETALKRAAVKYGEAIAHTRHLAEYLSEQYDVHRPGETYDLEMSVDETSSPTRAHEHYFVAAELRRLGLEVTSLAPRFVGDFEKGIDYIGDLDAFEEAFEVHSAIAGAQGGYKLSIHSGSDKFSVYPIIGRHAGDHVHLKTAGTSFLEALRIPARHAPDFFRDIVDFAFERFGEDRATYHVTTDLSVVPDPSDVADEALEETYLDEDNGRQLLHITYGSILSATRGGEPRFKTRLLTLLTRHEEEHFEALKAHVLDHIEGVGAMTVRSDL